MIKINISFCFDKNLWKQAGVAITSLLISAKKKCSYDIYAVVSDDVTDDSKSILLNLVKENDKSSNITFLTAKKINKKVNHPLGYYFRLLLPELLPNIKKIIYCDIDTVFLSDLISLSNINMQNNIIYGAKDGLNLNRPWRRYQNKTDKQFITKQGYYINSGVLLMNLKYMREKNLYEKFISLIGKKLWQKDQDILNYTCFPKIGFLPMKYNFTPRATRKYHRMIKQGVIGKQEIIEAKNNSVIYHFINCNPWDKSTKNSWIWWKYAHKTPFYNELKNRYLSRHKFLGWIYFMIIERKILREE